MKKLRSLPAHLFPVILLLFVIQPFGCAVIKAQSNSISAQDSLTLFQFLSADTVLRIHIKTNLRKLIRTKAKREKFPGSLTIDGQERGWNINIRARGNIRNEICYFPPLKIDFSKKELAAAGISPLFDDLKLVLRCKDGSQYENYVFREYLCYKMYNILTDKSYRVQLIYLTLEDTEGKQKPIESHAFLIEKDDELAARLKGRVHQIKYVKEDYLLPEFFDLVSVFQYMIGNTDWYIPNKHNLTLLKLVSYPKLVTVPYDFDYTGLVNASYATPHENLPIASVKTRLFLGACRPDGTYEPILALFQEKRPEILSCIENFGQMDAKSKAVTLDYINDFFDILDNPRKVKNWILRSCDTQKNLANH